jgi:hypothetical protein
MLDRNGQPFEGTAAELKKHNDKLRKRQARAVPSDPVISLPLPAGTAAALADVMARAGFDDPRDFLAFQIHRLALLDSPDFELQTKRTVRVRANDLKKYHHLLDGFTPDPEDTDDE